MTVDNPAVVFNTINNTLKQAESKDGLPVYETIVKVTSPLAYIDGVPYSSGEIWSNWANTLSATPERFFYPTTLEDLQVIIRQANANKKKVRCVATGHSWSGTAVTQDYMVSVNNMNRIEKPVKGEDGTWTVMIEMGVQVSALDEYLRKHDPPLALSSNVMPADIRYGGIFSMGCHGAALHTTMSDELTEITIVNAYGELHIYSEADDAEAFDIACVNLGLLGIVYTATIKVQLMNDYRLRAIDSYEPLETFFGDGPDAGLKLKEMVMANDSTELFYWPTARFMKHERNEHFWLKQWRRTTDPVEDPNKYKVQPPTVDHPGFAAFKVGNIVKDLPDAIHFDVTKPGEGAGVRRIFDASAAFKVDSNFKNVVEVMNELVDKNWTFSSSEFPRRLFTIMEVRFIRGSRKTMSFVYDEGDEEAVFCVINVMGSILVPGFLEFSGEILGAWMNKYNAKPHWAKLWEHIPDVIPTLRREYKDRLEVFNRIRRTQDPFDMFVNDTWRPFIEEREE